MTGVQTCALPIYDKSVTVGVGESYTFEEDGTYKLVYTVKNPTKNAKGNRASAKATRNVVAELGEDTSQPEVPVDE